MKSFARRQIGWAIFAIVSVVLFIGCSSSSTDSDSDERYTISFNLTLPPDLHLDGKTARASIYNNWGDTAALKTSTAVIDSLSATLQITDVAEGSYQIIVAVDINDDGFVDIPVDPGDLFWGVVNIQITQNLTINLTQYYWQRFHSEVLCVQGIPYGNDGKICAVGIFFPGSDVLSGGVYNVPGGAAIIYNNCALIAINPPDVIDSTWQLPSGTYDIWSVIDLDGQPEDWFEDSTVYQFTDGDLIDSVVNWSYVQDEMNWSRISFSYYSLAANNIVFNVDMPDDLPLNGHHVYFTFWDNWADQFPVRLDSVTVTNNQADITLPFFVSRTYMVKVIVDVDNSGPYNLVSRGDLIWGALDITTDEDMTIDIQGAALQHYESIVFVLDDLPSGHDGRPLGMALVYDGQMVLPRDEPNLANGTAVIYHNSAFLAANISHNYPNNQLETGDYDVWFLIDADGQIEDYDDSLNWPVTVNDQYYIHNYHHEDGWNSYFVLIGDPTFTPLVGVMGTITCPNWVSGGGSVYVFLFNGNPLQDTLARELNWVALPQPGQYQIPIMPNIDFYAVGYWDADSSGSDGGPTAGDMIGGYSQSGNVDSLILLNSGQSGQSGIDFELNTPYSPR